MALPCLLADVFVIEVFEIAPPVGSCSSASFFANGRPSMDLSHRRSAFPPRFDSGYCMYSPSHVDCAISGTWTFHGSS